MAKYFDKKKRGLLFALVVADFKLRYQDSVLGYLWSLVRPMALFAVLYVVFVEFFKIGADVPHFAVYLLLGIMLWNFFAEATGNGLSALVDKADMIRKVYTPKYAIILAAVLSATINLVINLFVVFLFALLNGVDFSPVRLLLLPLAIIQLFVVAAGISFLLASLYVKYRDIKYIWELFIQIGFYATPILYPLSRIPENFVSLLMFNPLAQILQDARFAVVTDKTPTAYSVLGKYFFVPFVISLVVVIFSIWYFKTKNRYVAEEL